MTRLRLVAHALFFVWFPLLAYAHPFAYDLHVTTHGAHAEHALVCVHGYGGDYTIGARVAQASGTQARVVSFNLPDFCMTKRKVDPLATSFGTKDELLPVFYCIKQLLDQNVQRIDLYGFSAGAAVIINCLATLASGRYRGDLAQIGFTRSHAKRLIALLEKSVVLLDAPLKSLEEIVTLRPHEAQLLEQMAHRYAHNNLRPIDSIRLLKNLKLHIVVYFETPDQTVGNRDDELFANRLTLVNSLGTTTILRGSHGGHNGVHTPLWQAYVRIIT